MKEELIKFVMERADREYSDDFPINRIPEWIDEFFNHHQPERSKREDSLIREMMKSSAVDVSKIENMPPYPLVWDKNLNFIGHRVIEEMRCSEHDGNVVREVR